MNLFHLVVLGVFWTAGVVVVGADGEGGGCGCSGDDLW